MKKAAEEMGKATASWDDSGSLALQKDSTLEQEFLNDLPIDLKTLLPQDWMNLACFRTRKYDVERTKKLIGDFNEVLKELNATEKLTVESVKAVGESGAFQILPGRDKFGRMIMNTRLRFHKPKEMGTQPTLRFVLLMILNTLIGAPFHNCSSPAGGYGAESNAEATQLNGFCVLHDFGDVTFSNIDPAVGKSLLKLIGGRMPARVGAIYMLKPPFFLRYIMLPVLRLFLNAKLSQRIIVLNSEKELLNYFDVESLPEVYGGTMKIDSDFMREQVLPNMKDMVV